MSSKAVAFPEAGRRARSREEAKWVEGIKELIPFAKDKKKKECIEALSILWELREDKDVKKRDTAIKALGVVAKTNDEALEYLIRLADGKYSFWAVAVKALGETGKVNEQALIYLKALTNDKYRWNAAIAALGETAKTTGKALKHLIDSTKNKDKCFAAIEALGNTATGRPECIQYLSELGNKGDELLQHAVISALKLPAIGNEEALEALVSFSNSDFILSKIEVARALEFLIKNGDEDKYIKHLEELAEDKVGYVREETNKLIGDLIRGYAISKLDITEQLLSTDSEAIRNDAISGLGIAAAGREDALNKLKGLTEDRKLLIRKAATKAIGKSVKENPDDFFGAFDFLQNLVLDKKKEEYIRMNAIEGLCIAMASKPEEVLDIIESLIEKEELILIKKYAAEKVLAKVEEDYIQRAFECLKILMRDPHPVVSAAAVESMVSIISRYPKNEAATDALNSLFDINEKETVRINTIKSLSEIELSKDVFTSISPHIRNLIHDDKILVKKSLAKGLANIGETYEDTVDLLENLLHDPFEDIQETATSSAVSLAFKGSEKAKKILTKNINWLGTFAHNPSEEIKRTAIKGLLLVYFSLRQLTKTKKAVKTILEELETEPHLSYIIKEETTIIKSKTESYDVSDFFVKLSSGSDQIKLHLLHYEDRRNVERKTETKGVIEIKTGKKFFETMTPGGISDATSVEIKHIDGYTVGTTTRKHKDHFLKTSDFTWDTNERKTCYFLSEEGYKAAKEIEEDVKNKSIEVRQGGKSEYRRLEDIYNKINSSIEEKYKNYGGGDKDLKIAAESKSYMWTIKRWAIYGRKLDLDAIKDIL